MFRLHESTRTFLCRLSFILLGLLPTCCCATYAIFVNRESYQKQLAVEIGRRLNMIASCRSASHPLPDVTRYIDFELRDPETNELLASAPILTITTHDENTLLTSPSVELKWNARSRLMRLCDDRISAGSAPQQPINVRFEKVEIVGLLPNEKLPLYHVTALDGLINNAREGAIGFFTRPNPVQGERPAEIHLTRTVASDPLQPSAVFPRSSLRIESGSMPLPCALIGGKDCVNQFGPHTTFFGKAFIEFLPNLQKISVNNGRLENVNLESIGKIFSLRISGMANFNCNSLVIENGRVKNWSGAIESRQGKIGRKLAESLTKKLSIRDFERGDRISDIHFDILSCRIEWNDNNIQLSAFDDCDGDILQANNDRIWKDPEGKFTTPATLLDAFKPEGLQTVPSISFLEKMWR